MLENTLTNDHVLILPKIFHFKERISITLYFVFRKIFSMIRVASD
jgi:hypothetical protein